MKPEMIIGLSAMAIGCLVGIGWSLDAINRTLKRIAKALEEQNR